MVVNKRERLKDQIEYLFSQMSEEKQEKVLEIIRRELSLDPDPGSESSAPESAAGRG